MTEAGIDVGLVCVVVVVVVVVVEGLTLAGVGSVALVFDGGGGGGDDAAAVVATVGVEVGLVDALVAIPFDLDDRVEVQWRTTNVRFKARVLAAWLIYTYTLNLYRIYNTHPCLHFSGPDQPNKTSDRQATGDRRQAWLASPTWNMEPSKQKPLGGTNPASLQSRSPGAQKIKIKITILVAFSLSDTSKNSRRRHQKPYFDFIIST